MDDGKKLFPQAPMSCFGRRLDAKNVDCMGRVVNNKEEQPVCMWLAECAVLYGARTEAGILRPEDMTVPSGYQAPLALVGPPPAPPTTPPPIPAMVQETPPEPAPPVTPPATPAAPAGGAPDWGQFLPEQPRQTLVSPDVLERVGHQLLQAQTEMAGKTVEHYLEQGRLSEEIFRGTTPYEFKRWCESYSMDALDVRRYVALHIMDVQHNGILRKKIREQRQLTLRHLNALITNRAGLDLPYLLEATVEDEKTGAQVPLTSLSARSMEQKIGQMRQDAENKRRVEAAAKKVKEREEAGEGEEDGSGEDVVGLPSEATTLTTAEPPFHPLPMLLPFRMAIKGWMAWRSRHAFLADIEEKEFVQVKLYYEQLSLVCTDVKAMIDKCMAIDVTTPPDPGRVQKPSRGGKGGSHASRNRTREEAEEKEAGRSAPGAQQLHGSALGGLRKKV